MELLNSTYQSSCLIPETIRYQTLSGLVRKFQENLKPRENLSTAEWADKHRELSPEDCDNPGRFSHEGFEYLKGFEDAFDDPEIREITAIKSGQTAFTTAALNMIGKSISQEPAPWLVVYPTDSAMKKFSKRKFAPMVRDSAILRNLISESKKRDGDNNISEKSFPGGSISMVTARSVSNLAAQSIKYLLLDELDRIPWEAGNEGDTVEVVKKRTQGFKDSCKIIKISTPTTKGVSRIDLEWEQSDQRYYHVPCPKCKKEQTLKWKQVKFDIDLPLELVPNSAYYECENSKCKAKLDDADIRRMVANGKWIATKPEVKSHAGFYIWEIYSPLSSLAHIVKQFLPARKDQLKLKSFINLVLGEAWEDQTIKDIDTNQLMLRCEDYGPKLPDGVVALTCGVDTQDDRLEAKVKGWGLRGESWLIDVRVFPGNPGLDAVWMLLDNYLQKVWEHELGAKLMISATCIDMLGHHTHKVLEFCDSRSDRRIFAVHGKGGQGIPIVTTSVSKSKFEGRIYKSYTIGVDAAKELIFSRLSILDFGPGYMHFPKELNISQDTNHGDELDKEYFEQLTAEKLIKTFDKGVPKLKWKQMRARNEKLDIEVYALAAFLMLNYQETDLEYIADLIKDTAEEVEETQQKEEPVRNWVHNY